MLRGLAVVYTLGALLASAAPAHGDDSIERVIDRVYVSGHVGDGWTTRYYGERFRSAAVSGGVAASTVIGVDNFGLELGVGLGLDPGTTPDPAMEPRDPLWMIDVGVGLASSPYALIDRPRLELRLDVGIRLGVIVRRGCPADRCDSSGEPTSGILPIGRAGLVAWFGEGRRHGVALDLVMMRGRLGDLDNPSNPTDAELIPPTWLIRVSWLPYHRPQRQMGPVN